MYPTKCSQETISKKKSHGHNTLGVNSMSKFSDMNKKFESSSLSNQNIYNSTTRSHPLSPDKYKSDGSLGDSKSNSSNVFGLDSKRNVILVAHFFYSRVQVHVQYHNQHCATISIVTRIPFQLHYVI